MNAVVFEHVPVSELPAAWRAKLSKAAFARMTQVTVRIEEEEGGGEGAADPPERAPSSAITANPLFGMWRDRNAMADVAAHVRDLRGPRFNPDGSPRKA